MHSKIHCLSVIVLFLAGCARVDTTPVQLTGRVFLDDKPLDDVFVQFWVSAEDQAPYGSSRLSDENGNFEMKARGLKPGRYLVRIMESRRNAPRVPERYALPETTPLVHEVGPDDTDWGTFRLTRP